MEKKLKNVVTYQKIAKNLNHFEIAALSFYKAYDLIKSATYLNDYAEKGKPKPKVSAVALNILCSDADEAKKYEKEVVNSIFNAPVEDAVDEYTVAEEHLLPNSSRDMM